jgi:hypothetical protein
MQMTNDHKLAMEINKIFIQVGAGAGDLDSRAGFRDGFSEMVKSYQIKSSDRIILVEPNPKNIFALRKCWGDYSVAEIYEVGIVPKKATGHSLVFYYSELDAPHYQVGSFNPTHVIKHYPNQKIQDLTQIVVSSIDLEAFLTKTVGCNLIEILCLDIEGLDSEVILDTDFSLFNIRFLSIEHLHLGIQAQAVVCHLEQCGFSKSGNGVDHNGFDWMFIKVN